MEQRPHQREGGEQPPEEIQGGHGRGGEPHPAPHGLSLEYGYLRPIPPEGDSWDEWVIERGIEAAAREDRNIDDRTAHYIAAQLHEGQASALYSLASTGNISPDIHDELTRDFDQQTERVRNWINWFGTYCMDRADHGPLEGWNERVRDRDRDEIEALRRNQTIAELDTLFGEQPAEEIGDVGELGWFGLVRHQGRPGGLILSQDEQGFKHVWETDSDQELQDRWAAVNQEYDRFYGEVTESAARAEGERSADDHSPGELVKRDRLANLDERLAPLPDLGDIPRPGSGETISSGYEWMEQLPDGWHVEPSWGRDGWDLGAWPLIVVALFVDEKSDRYAVATYTEGDVTVNRYQSRGALYVAVNKIAEFHWRMEQSLGPDDLPEGEGLLAKHCGPYSRDRYDREVVAELAGRERPSIEPDTGE